MGGMCTYGSLEAKRRRPNSRIHRYLLVYGHGHCMQTHGHRHRHTDTQTLQEATPNAPNATSHISQISTPPRTICKLIHSQAGTAHTSQRYMHSWAILQYFINMLFTFWLLAAAPICKLLDPTDSAVGTFFLRFLIGLPVFSFIYPSMHYVAILFKKVH